MHPLINPNIGTFIENNPLYRWWKNNGQDHVHLRFGVTTTIINPTTVNDPHPWAPCTVYIDEYNTNSDPGRNGIYWVKEPMALYITRGDFHDVINHLKNGTLVKMTPTLPIDPDTRQTVVIPSTVVGSEQTNAFMPYHKYGVGDCIYLNVGSDDSGVPDYSVYYLSLLENQVQGVWTERWDVKTSMSIVPGLYADMMGPRTFILDEPPELKTLRDTVRYNRINDVRFDNTTVPVNNAGPDGEQRLNFYSGAYFENTQEVFRFVDEKGVVTDIYDYVNAKWLLTSITINAERVKDKTDNHADPNVPALPPLQEIIWTYSTWVYTKTQAPRIKGLKYIAQDGAEDQPVLYVFDGFKWQPIGTATTIPEYNDNRRYIVGEVVHGNLYGKYPDTQAVIQTWGIFRCENAKDEYGQTIKQWSIIYPKPLYDADITDVDFFATRNPYYPNFHNGDAITVTEGQTFYVKGIRNGRDCTGIYRVKTGVSSFSISVDMANFDDPFHDLVSHESVIERLTGPDMIYRNDIPSPNTYHVVQGLDIVHDFIPHHRYNKGDMCILYNVADKTNTKYYYRAMFSSGGSEVSGAVMDLDELLTEWLCLADIRSSFGFNIPDPSTGRLSAYIHAAPKATWPDITRTNLLPTDPDYVNPNDCNDIPDVPRIDTLYVDTTNSVWVPYIFRYTSANAGWDYIPVGSEGGGGRCFFRTIPNDQTTSQAVRDDFHIWRKKGLTDYDGPIYLSDPNVGDDIRIPIGYVVENGQIKQSTEVKKGDFIVVQGPDATGKYHRLFCSIYDDTYATADDPDTAEMPRYWNANILSAAPITGEELDFDLAPLGGAGVTLYNTLLTKDIGSQIALPVPLYYREGTMLSVKVILDANNSFNAVIRIEKHSYATTNPTVITLFSRYNDGIGISRCLIRYIANAQTTQQATRDDTHIWRAKGIPDYDGPIYLSDPNIGDNIRIPIGPVSDSGVLRQATEVKKGDFIIAQGPDVTGKYHRLFCTIVDDTFATMDDPDTAEMPRYWTAILISAAPIAGDTLDFNLAPYGTIGEAMYDSLLTKEPGSQITLPEILFYREGTILSARILLDANNSFNVIARVEKHTYETTDPTVVTLLSRFNDARAITLKDAKIVDSAGNVLTEIDISITKNPVTKLITNFEAWYHGLTDGSDYRDTIPAGDYSIVDGTGSPLLIKDRRIMGQEFDSAVINAKADPTSTGEQYFVDGESASLGIITLSTFKISSLGGLKVSYHGEVPGDLALNPGLQPADVNTVPKITIAEDPVRDGVPVPVGSGTTRSTHVIRPAGDPSVALMLSGPSIISTDLKSVSITAKRMNNPSKLVSQLNVKVAYDTTTQTTKLTSIQAILWSKVFKGYDPTSHNYQGHPAVLFDSSNPNVIYVEFGDPTFLANWLNEDLIFEITTDSLTPGQLWSGTLVNALP